MASEAGATAGHSFAEAMQALRHWWHTAAIGTVDQAAVIANRRAECELSARYMLMLCMSAGIAILGLLLSSPAVVIGAMLLSPLMDPIMGLGFGLATGDYQWTKRSAKTLVVGTLVAVLFCALVVFLSPLQTVTSEIAARTEPNLFDLLIAFFSAIAGAYAMIRGREGTIVGVAIATALMPPLAVVGFGLATFNWTVFFGALLLFFTNLMTIALTATLMARLYGFSTALSERQTAWQTIAIVAAFLLLAVPLGLSLVRIGWEARAARSINSLVMAPFDDRARLSQVETDFDAVPILVSATVLTPELQANAERIAARTLTARLGEPVDVVITQYRVGTSAQAAEEAQLSAALRQEQAAAAEAEELAERLALVAGVPASQVTVDRGRRRATVTARPLDGATLQAYYQLENRIRTATDGEWDIRLSPPVLALPSIEIDEEAVTAGGQRAIALVAWAAQRSGLPVRLEGRSDAVALVRVALQEQGVQAQEAPSGGGYGNVRAVWVVPEGAQ